MRRRSGTVWLVARRPDPSLPRCPVHPDGTVRREGTYGKPPRPRYRCFYTDAAGAPRKHGFTPIVPRRLEERQRCPTCEQEVPVHHGSPMLPGGLYGVAEVAEAMCAVAGGVSYTEALRRLRIRRQAVSRRGLGTVEGGQTVADWVDRFTPVLERHYGQDEWAETIVCDSTEFDWTNPRTGVTEQLFAILAVWGYPAGARDGSLWALRAVPSDTKGAWKELLATKSGSPALVIYDGDLAIGSAVRESFRGIPLHLCEHHFYVNGAKALAKDGEHGMGNRFRAPLNDAARSPRHWVAFRRAVAQAGLVHTVAWVAHWDAQLTAQTAWRKTIPAHYSTGALDPKITEVRQMLERRRWTFRNLTRMNHLLELIRLHLNRQDSPADWARVIKSELETVAGMGRGEGAATLDFRRSRAPVLPRLSDPVAKTADGSRIYTLRKHPVAVRA